MTVKEIKAKLDELNIAYKPNNMSKAELEALLPAIPAAVTENGVPSEMTYDEDADVSAPPSAPIIPVIPRSYKLTVKFKGTDEEGDKTTLTYEGEGTSLVEALEKLAFPPRISALFKVSVTVGDKTFSRSFAPHKWNYIFENKDARELARLLGL